jgi:tRNA pseudouridine55 synthase
MSRRRTASRVDGWLFLDKPAGMTSTRAVSIVRRTFNARKAGHSGTLDPFATGLLPIALGEATKAVPFMLEADKTYEFTVRWGMATDTCDVDGSVIAESAVRPARDVILAALPGFEGEIKQVPPAYSALKVAGRRAYDLARAGQHVELQPRHVHVRSLRVTAIPDADHAVFQLQCGKGTYVRSLARDLAERLGTCAHVTRLRRLRVGAISVDDAVSLEDLERQDPTALATYLHPVHAVLSHLPCINLEQEEVVRIRHGNPLPAGSRSLADRLRAGGAGENVLLMHADRAVAIATLSDGALKPRRVFQVGES